MRILLDECVNAGVKAAFFGHSVKTVAEMGWRGLGDHLVLTRAEGSFDAIVTIDRKLEHQQNIPRFRVGIVVVRVPNNRIESYLPLFPALLDAVISVKIGEMLHV